jgi:hypothetical protein
VHQGRRHERGVIDGHQAATLGDPRIDDELSGLALELGQDRVDRQGDTGDDSSDVTIDQLGQLITIATLERADLDGHGRASRSSMVLSGSAADAVHRRPYRARLRRLTEPGRTLGDGAARQLLGELLLGELVFDALLRGERRLAAVGRG